MQFYLTRTSQIFSARSSVPPHPRATRNTAISDVDAEHYPGYARAWTITFESLEELLTFHAEVGSLVLEDGELEIYDRHRE
jgi:hypothetical protein